MSLQSFVLDRINSIHEITAKHLYKDANTILLTRSITQHSTYKKQTGPKLASRKIDDTAKKELSHIYYTQQNTPLVRLKSGGDWDEVSFFPMAACGDSDVYPS